EGIVVAILASLLGLASQTAQPPVYVIGRKPGEDVLRPLAARHPDDETVPGLLILRPEGRLFFINVQHVAAQIRELIETHQPEVVVLDMSRVQDVEYSALMMLMEGEQQARARGVTLWLAGLNPGVLENVRRSGLASQLGESRMLFNARAAIRQYQQGRE
ncbi:MAG: sodium-independent anion transporter, partial [Aeromonas sp.]|nr:sodium-independent anion transporter [Aeromonas sp.]